MNMKKVQKIGLIAFALILMVVAIACNPTVGAVEASTNVLSVDEDGAASIETKSLQTALETIASGELTETEVEGLVFMREEEKLARDVYLYLYEQWGVPVFQNIAKSEDTHTEAVRTLLERYGVADPAVSTEAGVFTNPDLQALYDQLTAQGSQSLKDALLVGAAIEEIDILDIEEYIAATDKADIILVYENLISGSENHLRAFVRSLSNQVGEDYAPQYLSQEVYDAIINASSGNGWNGSGQNNGNNGRGNGQGRRGNG